MSNVDRYLPASLNDADTEEVGLMLAKAQAARSPGALEELVAGHGEDAPGAVTVEHLDPRLRVAVARPQHEPREEALLVEERIAQTITDHK